jgi:hypothetical protein
MTKKQKIWLSVFLAMFLAPFAMWLFGVRGAIDVPWFPISDLRHFLDIASSFFLVLCPLIGLVGIFLIVKKASINKRFKTIFFVALVSLICFYSFVNFMFFWAVFYYMVTSPQIG